MLVSVVLRTERGMLFQAFGPATEKEREPIVVCYVLGMRSESVSDEDRRVRDGAYR